MSRILLLLDPTENRHLLAEELGRMHEVRVASADVDIDQPFDLCVLDGPALDRLQRALQERRAREQPLILPVLLVTSRPGVQMITRQLWQCVDELIITPVEKEELWARVAILLRARSLSLSLRERVEAAEQATRMRDEVMAMVSHDLRVPLNLVLAHASLLLDSDAAREPQVLERAAAIHKAVARMDHLIGDLIEIARLESGRIAVDPTPWPVDELVRGAVRGQEHAAQAKKISISHETAPGVPLVVVDRNRVDQVFGNLIDNAIKFTPEGGAVTIRAEPSGGGVRFSVVDTGPGIPEADHPHVFDRFWQARRTGSGGAGLGLAISKAIVEAHAGRMGFESAPGQGSTFWFELPAAEGA